MDVALCLPRSGGGAALTTGEYSCDPFGIEEGEDDLSDRRWRRPEVALRLPPANGSDPSGIRGGGVLGASPGDFAPIQGANPA